MHIASYVATGSGQIVFHQGDPQQLSIYSLNH